MPSRKARYVQKPPQVESVTRRHETIAGHQVTVITRGNIETVRGGPRCRWCGKPLRPKYFTKRTPKTTRHYYDEQPKHVSATFDAARRQWMVVSTAFRVVQRTFQGAFGMYGDNYFCGLNCGRDYALAIVDGVTKQQLRLIDPTGKNAQVCKSK
jgi:hypothetical protein